MKKFLVPISALLVVILLLVGIVGLTFANGVYVNRTPTAILGHSSDYNHANFWENVYASGELADFCIPISGWDGDVYYLSDNNVSLLILKSATNNFVWYNPNIGYYGTPTEQDISHGFICFYEQEETETPTPTNTFTPTPTETEVPTETPTPTNTPTEIPTKTPTKTPEKTPTPGPCVWNFYILDGLRYDCWLYRNYSLGDKKNDLPSRYDDTDYMYELCALYNCDGTKRLDFEWNGKWTTTCATPVPCNPCP